MIKPEVVGRAFCVPGCVTKSARYRIAACHCKQSHSVLLMFKLSHFSNFLTQKLDIKSAGFSTKRREYHIRNSLLRIKQVAKFSRLTTIFAEYQWKLFSVCLLHQYYVSSKEVRLGGLFLIKSLFGTHQKNGKAFLWICLCIECFYF